MSILLQFPMQCFWHLFLLYIDTNDKKDPSDGHGLVIEIAENRIKGEKHARQG